MVVDLCIGYFSRNILNRWVVITTINPPTATIQSLAKIGKHCSTHLFILSENFCLEDWCLVLVFDKKTPENAYNNTQFERVVSINVHAVLTESKKNCPRRCSRNQLPSESRKFTFA